MTPHDLYDNHTMTATAFSICEGPQKHADVADQASQGLSLVLPSRRGTA